MIEVFKVISAIIVALVLAVLGATSIGARLMQGVWN